MSDQLARKRAELELLEAEAAFKEKKAAGELTNEDRAELHAVRTAYRLNYRQPVKDGAAPEVIGTEATVEDL